MLCFYLKYSTILSTLKITDTQNLGHQIVFAKPNMANIIILYCLILGFFSHHEKSSFKFISFHFYK